MGMKTQYVPTNVNQKCHRPRLSFIMRPNILGNQSYVAAKIPKIEATPMIKWKCPVTKAVSCNGISSVGCARNGPLIPPDTNKETNPMANSIGDTNRIRPPHNVPNQLNVLIAEGTPIAIVIIEKAKAEYGLMPLMNMWWPQTMNPSRPIDSIAYTIALYPKIGFRENTETS